MELMEFKKILDQAILGTSEKYPTDNMGKKLEQGLKIYYENLKKGQVDLAKKEFANEFTRKSERYGIELRLSIVDYANNNDCDIALAFLDVLFKYCCTKLNDYTIDDYYSFDFSYFARNYVESVGSRDSSLNAEKEQIYADPEELISLINGINTIINHYQYSLDAHEVFNFDSIEIEEVTNTAKELLTSSTTIELKDSIAGTLLDGKISIATDRGYKKRPGRPQQDAVLSIVKSNDCYLNVVADGMGGGAAGEYASRAVIDTFEEWFNQFNEDQLKSLDNQDLLFYIDDPLKRVNNEIYRKYSGKAGTTIALTLTVGERTIICNLGDSTIYTYNAETDEIIELTKRDALTGGFPYEEARNNMNNNVITASIGGEEIATHDLMAHYSIIANRGQKIIITSDGVTDLIAEERFKEYFKKEISAQEIVDDAVNRPDITRYKSEDNTSAIVVTLPNYEKEKGAEHHGRR